MKQTQTFKKTPLAIALMVAMSTQAGELPTGGNIVAGSGAINSNGNTLTVQQNSDKLITNWQGFSIGKNNTVNFNQPNKNAVALNRVLGNNASNIYGHLNANGQVFLVNPNGVLFAKGASVNVGGLVASTLNISDNDFLNGQYQFTGNGHNAAVVNKAHISAAGSTVALLGGSVSNQGTIEANLGTVALAAGDKINLDFAGDGLVNVSIDQGQLDALVANHGAIKADGGKVLLTTHAAGQLLNSVVNNTGVIRAQSLENNNGEIILLADKQNGTANIAGTLDASAKGDNNGGFIETSGATVNIDNSTHVTTQVDNGNTGTWLIDPTDFTVSAGSASQSNSGIGADTLSANLANNNVTLQTVAAGTENGDIFIDASISWDAATTLSLDAHNDIFINAPVSVENSGGGLALDYGGSGYRVNAPVSFTAGSGGLFTVNGNAFTLIRDVDQLQAMDQDLTGRYVLATDIDASATAGWNGGKGFAPVAGSASAFSGEFDGLGHTVDALHIDRPMDGGPVGLFGYVKNARLAHVGLTGVQISGNIETGALAGIALDARVNNSFSVGDISGSKVVGGLIGFVTAVDLEDSHAHGTVSGGGKTGGLVGDLGSRGHINDSYSDASVTGTGDSTGGLVGWSHNGEINRSHAAGVVTGINDVGGLVGRMEAGRIERSYATGAVAGNSGVGGLVGRMDGGRIERSYATGAVTGPNGAAGLVGRVDASGYIGRSWASGQVGSSPFTAGLVGTGAFYATITNSYWDTDTSGQPHGCIGNASCSGGATGLATNEAFTQSQYSNFDFTNDWFMLDGDTRPFLRSEYSTSISNAHQLQLMAMDLTASYTLENNIDASATAGTDASGMWGAKGFKPIGNNANRFTGALDGLGHTISGLTINRTGEKYVGLFGRTNSSNLSNVGLVGGSITGQSYVGGLVGKNSGNITTSYTTVTVTGKRGVVGGLVGDNSGNITTSYATGAVTGSNAVGGLVGDNDSGGRISTSYATGVVTSKGNVVGGLAGQNSGDISISYATGAVKGSNILGGLVGDNYFGHISKSYATGAVTGKTNDVGGLVGANYSSSMTNSYWDKSSTTQTNACGSNSSGSCSATGLSSEGMHQLASFSGWDIDKQGGTNSVWRIYEGHSAPLLRSFLTELTINTRDASTTYNGATQAGDGNWTAAGGYDANFLQGTATGSKGGKNAGSHSISIDGLYSSQQGYDLTITDGTLTINKADLAINAVTDSKTYDGNTSSTVGVTYSGLQGSDTLSGLSQSFADKNVLGANNSALQVDSGYVINDGNGGNNYTPTTNTASGTISAAPLTINATTDSKTYDGNTSSTVDVTYSGLQGSDTLSGLSQSFADKNVLGANNSTLQVDSGYVINDGNNGNNYTPTTNTASGTISAAPLTINATTDSKTYDGNTASNAAVKLVGLQGSDTLSDLSQSFADKNVLGANNSTLQVDSGYVINDGNGGNNYTLTTNTASGTITPLAVDVTASASDKTYDATSNATVSLASGGILAGDSVNFSGTATFSDKNAATNKVVNVNSISASGADAGNYSLNNTTASTTADINAKVINSRINAQDKRYDGNSDVTLDASLLGVIAGDDVGLDIAAAFANSELGKNKAVILSRYQLTGSDKGNYQLQPANTITANINKKQLPASFIAANNSLDNGLATNSANFNAVGGQTLVLNIGDNALDLAVLTTQEQAGTLAGAAKENPTDTKQTLADVLPAPGSVLFPLNSVQIKNKQQVQALLTLLADYMKTNPKAKVVLTGYTDQSGSEQYNAMLSQQRAQAVADLMQQLGVKPEQVQLQNGASSNPLVADADTKGRQAQNRRVDFSLP